MNCGIYKIYWDNSPYFYYGKTTIFRARKNLHETTLKRGRHHNNLLQNAFNAFGAPKIELIKPCSESELNKWEHHFISNTANDSHSCNKNLKKAIRSSNPYIIAIRLTKANIGVRQIIAELAAKKKWSVNKYLNELIDKHIKKVKK